MRRCSVNKTSLPYMLIEPYTYKGIQFTFHAFHISFYTTHTIRIPYNSFQSYNSSLNLYKSIQFASFHTFHVIPYISFHSLFLLSHSCLFCYVLLFLFNLTFIFLYILSFGFKSNNPVSHIIPSGPSV